MFEQSTKKICAIDCTNKDLVSCDQLHNYDASIVYYLDPARAPATHRADATDIAVFLAWAGNAAGLAGQVLEMRLPRQS
jgi:hypothetical protein